ncbi:Supv3l1, partial [Symbiodinium sp. KB8]
MDGAFAAILGDGSVVTWGSEEVAKVEEDALEEEDEEEEVGLLSGRTATVQADLDESVAVLKRRAETALEVGKGRLVDSSGGVLDVDAPIKRARLQNGDSLVLHIGRAQVQSTYRAFAAVLGDRSFLSWGDPDSSAVHNQLKNVQLIQATGGAFAAIVADGSVVTWGSAVYGGDSSDVQDQLKNVQQIQAAHGYTGGAFAAI